MAQYTWIFDAPTGTYKQHALSQKIYWAALEDSVFMDHVRPVEGFGKKMGENVTLTRILSITEPTSATLTETQRISEDTLTINTTSIKVVEIGRAVPFTSLAQDLSWHDLENPVQRRLKDQMTLVMDTKAAAAYKTAQVKYIPTGIATGIFDTDGTASTSATENLNLFHVEEVADYLWDTLQAPRLANNDYVGIFRTLGLRGLKRDPAWEEWHKYTDPQAKFNDEIGRIERIRFIGTNHNNALGKKGTNSVLGEGVIFGEDSVALAEVQSPELRAAIPADFGRGRAVAWYAILGFGLIWDTSNAGEARVVHVTSS